MSRQMFLFRCLRKACGHQFDDYVAYSDIPTVKCEECGHKTERLITAPTIDPRMGLDPSFSTMSDKWAKVREQRAKIESAQAAKNGD
jgi:putative FmdB family regulatory protein